MKRAKLAFTLLSWGMGMIGGVLSVDDGWLGAVGVLFLLSAGFTLASALGCNFPKAMSDRWPHFYPPGAWGTDEAAK